MPEPDNELVQVYSAERQDDSSALTLAFTTATAGFTYMIAAILYIPHYYASHPCPTTGTCNCSNEHAACDLLPWLHLAVPTVLIIIMGFLVLCTAATRLRSVYLQGLEQTIVRDMKHSPLFQVKSLAHAKTLFHTESGVVWRSFDQPFKHPWFTRWIFGIIAAVMYGTLYASMVVFTIVMTTFGHGNSRYGWEAGYLVIETLVIFGLIIPLFHPYFKFKE